MLLTFVSFQLERHAFLSQFTDGEIRFEDAKKLVQLVSGKAKKGIPDGLLPSDSKAHILPTSS